MQDRINAFVPGTSVKVEGKPGGPLSGLSFAAKDLFGSSDRRRQP
ncbi:hypothetical protein [Oceanibaculum sp.]|nr:hypothetical protein [Oceanibaculum sp.]